MHPGVGVHPVRDGAREAERSCRQRVEVDGVPVTRHGGIRPAGVVAQAPLRADGHGVERSGGGRLGARGVGVLGAAGEVGADPAPDDLPAGAHLGDEVDLGAASVRAKVLGPHVDVEGLVHRDRPRDLDAVLDVDGAEERQGEAVAAPSPPSAAGRRADGGR